MPTESMTISWVAEAGVELSTVSTFAWLGFAYSLKFIWAPLVDTLRLPVLTRVLGRRRGWMLVAQLSIVRGGWSDIYKAERFSDHAPLTMDYEWSHAGSE